MHFDWHPTSPLCLSSSCLLLRYRFFLISDAHNHTQIFTHHFPPLFLSHTHTLARSLMIYISTLFLLTNVSALFFPFLVIYFCLFTFFDQVVCFIFPGAALSRSLSDSVCMSLTLSLHFHNFLQSSSPFAGIANDSTDPLASFLSANIQNRELRKT